MIASDIERVTQHLQTEILQGRGPRKVHRLQLGHAPRLAHGFTAAQIRDNAIHERCFANARIPDHHHSRLGVMRETAQHLRPIFVTANEERLQVCLGGVLFERFLKERASRQPESRPEGHIGTGEKFTYNT